MSSTNRSILSKEEREQIKDYYVTPIHKVEEFLKEFITYEPHAFTGIILDPCAGGDDNHEMSYPAALHSLNKDLVVRTLDIREDSLAETKDDYLTYEVKDDLKMIITNPPFNVAESIIRKALSDVEHHGFVVMLLRLNFYGGKERKKFWEEVGLPKYTFVHHRRMSFTDDGKTDSIEYAHFVWQKGSDFEFTLTKVI